MVGGVGRAGLVRHTSSQAVLSHVGVSFLYLLLLPREAAQHGSQVQ